MHLIALFHQHIQDSLPRVACRFVIRTPDFASVLLMQHRGCFSFYSRIKGQALISGLGLCLFVYASCLMVNWSCNAMNGVKQTTQNMMESLYSPVDSMDIISRVLATMHTFCLLRVNTYFAGDFLWQQGIVCRWWYLFWRFKKRRRHII